MITINDNSVPQINAALLRLNNVVDMDVDKLEKDISKLKSDTSKATSKLQQEIDEITAGTMVYTGGSHINISSSGVISVTGLATVAETGSYNDLINTPTIPAAQIQSDWDQTDTDAVDYIKNKPTIGNARINIYENGLASNSFTVNQDNNQIIKLGSSYSLYFCETNSYTQVKSCRLISGAGLFNGANKQTSAIIYFKYLNWRADAVITFDDDPNSNQYSPAGYNPTATGFYKTNNGRYAFGYGLYLVTHPIDSGNTTYVGLQALDGYSRAICTYATQPTTEAEFESTTVNMVFYSLRTQAGVNQTTDGSFLCYFPKCLLINNTYFRNINGSDSNSGSLRSGSFNEVDLTSSGKLLASALYRVQVSTNSGNWAARDIYTLNHVPGYTFVIRSANDWNAWANNTAGNDYTYILIKSGSYSVTTVPNISTTNTLLVEGEPGATINATLNNTDLITANSQTDCIVRGITFNVGLTASSGNQGSLYRVGTIENCTFNHTINSTGGYGSAIYNVHTVRDCVINMSFTSTTGRARAIRYANCVENCTITITGATSTNYLYGIIDSSNVVGNNVTITQTGTIYGVYNCKKVTRNTVSAATQYSNSYASTTTSSTYACADTPNGGFNA
jgi:hypothetical protein